MKNDIGYTLMILALVALSLAMPFMYCGAIAGSTNENGSIVLDLGEMSGTNSLRFTADSCLDSDLLWSTIDPYTNITFDAEWCERRGYRLFVEGEGYTNVYKIVDGKIVPTEHSKTTPNRARRVTWRQRKVVAEEHRE